MRDKGAQPSARLGSPTTRIEQVGFEAQERQRVIRRCALSVKRQESGTVIRSTSVVLIALWPARRSIAHLAHCLLGWPLFVRVVCPNKVGLTGGSSSVGRASAFQVKRS